MDPVFSWTGVLKKSPKISLAFFLLVLGAAQYSFAQCDGCTSPATAPDVLGVHNGSGRGCVGCHTPHSGSLVTHEGVSEQGGAAEAESLVLWGQNASPSYGSTVGFGDTENYVEVPAARVASPTQDVAGVLLCLSCHDGNITPQNMMSGQSYERKIGLLLYPARKPIPTLLGDGSLASDYALDHPLGADATIPLGDGLAFNNGAFSVTPGSPYARFMANYGLPTLAPGKRFTPYGGVDGAGKPYLLCTTCHNQHLITVYPSTATSPIGGDGGGRTYNTFFLANGPYNPEFPSVPNPRAPSTAQFCRQCHLNLANEGNNTLNIRTAFY